MTKPIMINGVDVSGCSAYYPNLGKKDDCIALGIRTKSRCENSPNCLYKQLQREKDMTEALKLDNEKLYKQAFKDGIDIANLQLKLARKTAECEDLKLENEDLKQRDEESFQQFEPLRNEVEAIQQKLKAKTAECEKIKEKLKPKIKNAHCVYFEGQTGMCRAKEFKKCNPVNCKLYTIDELSTILDLQKQLDTKTAECNELSEGLKDMNKIITDLTSKLQITTEALERISDVYMCNNCDGVGLDMGCADTDCGTYIANQALERIKE